MNEGFGERLRAMRLAAGISQVELAGGQLSPSYISLLEAGKRQPSADVVQLLAGRLRCTVGDLVNSVTREQAQRAGLEIAYARLALTNGEVADARNRLEALLPSVLSYQQLSDDVRHLLAEAYWRTGDYQNAIAAMLPVYEGCLARTSHLPLTTIGLRLTRFYLDAGDLQAAVRHGEAALRAMSEQGLEDTDEYLRAAATVMYAYYEIGDLAHASAWVLDLIERAERRGSPQGQAALYWNAALVAEAQGRLTDALHLSERALALLSEQNSSRDLGVLYTTCAHFLLEVDQTRAAQAVGLLERALPLLRDFASATDLGMWEGTRALAALAQGESPTAEEFARRAVLSLAGRCGPEGPQAQMSLGDALAAQGRTDEATASYLAAHHALDRCPATRQASAIWREIADRLIRTGQQETGIMAYRRALDAAGVRAPALPSDLDVSGAELISPAGADSPAGARPPDGSPFPLGHDLPRDTVAPHAGRHPALR